MLKVCFTSSGCRFDRSLGGFEMDLRLRDHLAKLFNDQKKSPKDVRENHRAMAKLLKEAQRLKTVLSANIDFMAQVSPHAFDGGKPPPPPPLTRTNLQQNLTV